MPEFKEPRKRKRKKSTPPKPAGNRRTENGRQSADTRRPVQKPSRRPPARKKAAKKGRGSLRLYYALMLVLGALVFAVLSVTVLFNIEEILVSEDSGYTEEEVIEASGLKKGSNIVRLNTKSAETKISDKLIWADSVKIEKKLPRSVYIDIQKAIPVASISDGKGNYYTVSQTGRVLEKERNPRNCVVIIGYEPNETEVGSYITSVGEKKTELLFELINTIEEVGLDNIIEIDMTYHLEINLNYADRVTIALGSSASLTQKLKNSVKMLEAEIGEEEEAILTVSNLQKITVSPKSVYEAIITTPEETKSETELETEPEIGE